eukprot:scaffold23891_cov132-Cylindrotheca_fusiformis.AAC.10
METLRHQDTGKRGFKRSLDGQRNDFKPAPPNRFRVPEVTVDGISYKSDRFYLNVAAGETYKHDFTKCHCGSKRCNPPPLFDREKLLDELLGKSQLEAVIMATFSFGLSWMNQRFPDLVGPKASIPTLILHGTKGLSNRLKQQTESGETIPMDPEGEEQENSNPLDHVPQFNFAASFTNDDEHATISSDTVDAQSLVTQEDPVSSPAGKLKSPLRPRQVSMTSLGHRCHLTEVLPTCDGSTPGVTHEKNQKNQRQWKFGVHHPKFMLLFEKSGDLIVVVSTANLVSSKTVEGSWIQRFHRRKTKPRPNFCPNNDFGPALQDFLKKLSNAGEDGHMKVDDFLSKYLRISLKEFSTFYHFEKSNVHLIPTIPGSFRSDSSNYKKYGRYAWTRHELCNLAVLSHLVLIGFRLRVASILAAIRDMPKTSKDSLILQPTSIGNDLRVRNLAHIGKSYLGCQPTEGNHSVLDRMTIVWPSLQFIASASSAGLGEQQVASKLSIFDEKKTTRGEEPSSNFVFLSAAGFNSCDMDCLCRLAQFEVSNPIQRAQKVVPHFKSIARICQNRKLCEGKGKDTFSWFLLTSACLSLGAQGRVESNGSGNTETLNYTNFELGVLFTSQRVDKSTGRLYCFHPHECCDQPGRQRSNLVHLPVPYSLEPRPYMDETEEKMNAMPYFHQIMPLDIGGNFMCTPYEGLARPTLQTVEVNLRTKSSISKKGEVAI